MQRHTSALFLVQALGFACFDCRGARRRRCRRSASNAELPAAGKFFPERLALQSNVSRKQQHSAAIKITLGPRYCDTYSLTSAALESDIKNSISVRSSLPVSACICAEHHILNSFDMLGPPNGVEAAADALSSGSLAMPLPVLVTTLTSELQAAREQ